MAFFEKMGQKISNAGQNVAQQTKNLTEVTRLNSQVSAHEKKIQALYAEIGKAYYAVSKDDPSAVARQAIEEVNGLFAAIEEAQERIHDIKGVVKCPQCGAELAQGAQFCSVCGCKVEVKKPEDPRKPQQPVCSNCGAVLEPDSLFCTNCGHKVESPVRPMRPDPAEQGEDADV